MERSILIYKKGTAIENGSLVRTVAIHLSECNYSIVMNGFKNKHDHRKPIKGIKNETSLQVENEYIKL